MGGMVGHGTGGRQAEPQERSGGKARGRKPTGPHTGCTHHCVACSGHFTSLAAFDAHRRGDHQAGTRYCDTDAKNAQGEFLLVVKSERGTCKLSYPPVVGSAVVWSTRGWEQAGARFREDAA